MKEPETQSHIKEFVMRALKYGALAASFGLVLGLLIGCGGSPTSNPPKASGGTGDDNTDKPKTAVLPGKATITGTVKYTGEKPDFAALNKAIDEALAKKPDDKSHCLNEKASDYEKSNPLWKINKDNDGVEYAVVFLKPEGDTFFALSPDDDAYKANLAKYEKTASKNPELHQPFCAFIPNSVVVFSKYRDKESGKKAPKLPGQSLVIYNDTDKPMVDKGIGHNSKVNNPDGKEHVNASIEAGKT